MSTLLRALKATIDTPKPFGAVHLIALGAAILLIALLCLFFRNADDKVYRRVLLVIWGVMIVMDVLRMLHMSYAITEEGDIVWGFSWSILPLQLCDAPLYLLPAIAILKEGKTRDALSAFMYSYVLLGGLVTFINISSIVNTSIFLTAQTVLHHGLQIVSCAFIAVHERKRMTVKQFLWGALVFVLSVIAVTAYNVILHAVHPEQGVNMYFISPYEKKVSPIFNDAWMQITGIWQILFYAGGVSAFAFILFILLYGVFYLIRRQEKRKSPNAVRA